MKYVIVKIDPQATEPASIELFESKANAVHSIHKEIGRYICPTLTNGQLSNQIDICTTTDGLTTVRNGSSIAWTAQILELGDDVHFFRFKIPANASRINDLETYRKGKGLQMAQAVRDSALFELDHGTDRTMKGTGVNYDFVGYDLLKDGEPVTYYRGYALNDCEE